MSEVSFFPKYEQKENRITNYTLLILKQIYNESPTLFQELMVNLLADEDENISIGVNFLQQEGYSCDKGKSIIDGVIQQLPFQVFIETKITDWFYNNQLERHLSNLSNCVGKKIFLALANFDGQSDDLQVFNTVKEKYSKNKDILIKNIEFEALNEAIKDIAKDIKSEVLSIMIKEYEQFLNEENLLPSWKYRLDVVNCAKSKDGVRSSLVYTCPEARGAYKHARSKYFGIYDNKNVNFISEILAVCNLDDDENGNNIINISWYDKDKYKNTDDVVAAIKNKIQYCPDERPIQVFLLDNIREDINFYKDTPGGMFGSKKYFNFDSNIKNIDDLIAVIKNQCWSKYL